MNRLDQALAEGWIACSAALEAGRQRAEERAVPPSTEPTAAAVHPERCQAARAAVCQAVGNVCGLARLFFSFFRLFFYLFPFHFLILQYNITKFY